jgi:dihydrofolate reductase
MMGFSISLDGFIATDAREDGGLHDWLFAGDTPIEVAGTEFNADSPASAEVFREVVDAIGAIIVGRTAFGGGEGEAFFNLPTFVLTHQSPTLEPPEKVTYVTGGIERALELATTAAGDKQVNIFGGAETAQQYLAAGLVDELRLTVVPVIFGTGLRLFGSEAGRPKGEIVNVVTTPTVTHMRFRLKDR